jgi:hypothetical protein
MCYTQQLCRGAATCLHHRCKALSGVGGTPGAGLSRLAGGAGAAPAPASTEAASRAQRTAGATTALQAHCMQAAAAAAAPTEAQTSPSGYSDRTQQTGKATVRYTAAAAAAAVVNFGSTGLWLACLRPSRQPTAI